MGEKWYPLEEWPDYEISKGQQVRSFKDRHGKIERAKEPHILKTRTDRNGYNFVMLRKDGRSHTALLHRLMAQTFIPNPLNKPEINHENGIKSDNSIANLTWCTRRENLEHAQRTGLSNVEESMGKAIKARQRKIYYYEEDMIFDSAAQAADYLNISRALVTLCCQGEVRGAKGHHLCYIEDMEHFRDNVDYLSAVGYGKRRLKAINLETGEERIYPSRKAASADLKIPNSYISSIISGRSYQTRGWTFEDMPVISEER